MNQQSSSQNEDLPRFLVNMLSFIPTPIGNKEDITLRALRLFRELSVFFCEDIWTTKKLFGMYEISLVGKQFYSFTSYTSAKSVAYYLDMIRSHHCGIVSEAGTPGISDPGKHFIKLCREQNIPFEILPGATALIPSVVATPTDTTVRSFYGFLPQKKWRKTMLASLIWEHHPVYIYESVHRIEKLIDELLALSYTGKIFIARELSKHFEQYIQGDLITIKNALESKTLPLKWEFVVWFFS